MPLPCSNRLRAFAGLWTQSSLTLAALGGIVVAPPANGAMVLVPIADRSIAPAVTIAVAAGGRVLARGPVAGSVVVTGERSRLLGPLMAHGILVTAAPTRWCAA